LPLVAKKRGVVVASFRLTFNTPGLGLPIHHAIETGEVAITSEEDLQWVYKAPAEITQLAKREDCEDINPTLALYGLYLRLGIPAVGAIDTKALRKLNGRVLNFNIPTLGSSSLYMGSECLPIKVVPEDVIENSKNGRNPNLHIFLQNGQALGFEWYVGR
jgi:hypothetical protein